MIGLVLAGGGAMGAYQAGAIQFLAERGVAPRLLAGTSVGALNAAALLSEPSFADGARRLIHTWDELGRTNVVRPAARGAIQLTTALASLFVPPLRWRFPAGRLVGERLSLLDPAPIEELVRRAIDPARILASPIEAWVAVFPSGRLPPPLDAGLVGDLAARWAGASAEWVRLQDLAGEAELLEVLLASAALPIAFPPRRVGGRHYIDGGVADNAPLAPLVGRGCTAAIVIHLENASTWDRHDERYADLEIIEIRPRRPIQASETPAIGRIASLLDFRVERIAELRRRGYEDARAALEPIVETLAAVRSLRRVGANLAASTRRLLLDPPLDD